MKLVIGATIENSIGLVETAECDIETDDQRSQYRVFELLNEWLNSLSKYDPNGFAMPRITFRIETGVNELEG